MYKHLIVVTAAIFTLSCWASAAVLEDFESYTNSEALTSVWKDRNGNGTISLMTSDVNALCVHDGTRSMNYDFKCNVNPYWTEAYRIFDANQDWSAYDTLNVWVKGRKTTTASPQSMEDMYLVLYSAKTANPTSHDGLSMLGKVFFTAATTDPNWKKWKANIDFNFDKLKSVRAIGIGMSPYYYGVGTIQLDGFELATTGMGGVIDGFEDYADANAFRAVRRVNGNATVSIDTSDANVFRGEKSLKVDYSNATTPWYTSIEFKTSMLERSWRNGSVMKYNPLTISFKADKAEGYLRVAFINSSGISVATVDYNGGACIPVGSWVTWDIDTSSFLTGDDPYVLDDITRVDVVFKPIDYGRGIVYLDDIHVNSCGDQTGDLNDDCAVDFADYAVFANQWFNTGCSSSNNQCNGANIVTTGTSATQVDVSDLAAMAYYWLECNMLYKGDCF